MYPGSDDVPGLRIAFDQATVILGANGLGKTTLVTTLFRMCTGPAELANFTPGGPLGDRPLEIRPSRSDERRLLANRVADKAGDATATLVMRIGQQSFRCTRSLRDLSLRSFHLDGAECGTDEAAFRAAVTKSAGVGDFSDWILLLRFITFYFEDRRVLVWDPSAQRRILRLLFLPPDMSARWAALEAAVLSADSEMRNHRAVFNRAERDFIKARQAAVDQSGTRDELAELQRAQALDERARDELSEALDALRDAQERARLDAAVSADLRESAYRELERLQLLSIASAFPTREETATYLLSKLITDQRCLVCGQHADPAVQALQRRVDQGQCVLCGSDMHAVQHDERVTTAELSEAKEALTAASTRSDAAHEEKELAEVAFAQAVRQVADLRRRILQRQAEIETAVSKLPPAEAAMRQQQTELSVLRARLDELLAELDGARSVYAAFIGEARQRIATQSAGVQQTFATFASDFLVERCELRYQSQWARIGQSGARIEYPGYDLDMTGATFEGVAPRENPDQVSESQREFIDLAFRMTLITVAGDGGAGSLIIDAPESSLDAVFVHRAANVLTQFANHHPDNRLVVTSNLIEGDLIPALLRQNGIRSSDDPRVIDLLDLAAPTGATHALRSDYEDVRTRLFARARDA